MTDSGINDPGDETLDNPDRLDTINEDSDRSDEEPEDIDDPEDSPLHTPPEDVPNPDETANPAPQTYYAVPQAVKTEVGFPAVFAASISSHFGAGLRPEIG